MPTPVLAAYANDGEVPKRPPKQYIIPEPFTNEFRIIVVTRLFRGCFSHGFKKNCYVMSSTDHHVGTRPSDHTMAS